MPFTEQKTREIKLLAEEDKNTRKYQKENKKQICTDTRSIVPRWEKFSDQGKSARICFILETYTFHRGHDGSVTR
jgi:hypothetical protein